MQLLPGGSPFSWPGKSGSRKIVSEPPCAICPTSRTWSDARSCPTAMRKRLSDTRGLGNHACFHHLRLDLTEACNQPCPSGPSGTRIAAGRTIVLTTSPRRSVGYWTFPATPARTSVLSSSTFACASAASALVFWAGRREESFVSMVCLLATAALSVPFRRRR